MDYEAMKSFVCKHTFGTWRKQKAWQSPLFVKGQKVLHFTMKKQTAI